MAGQHRYTQRVLLAQCWFAGEVQVVACDRAVPHITVPALGEVLPQKPRMGASCHLSSHNRIRVPNASAQDCLASLHLPRVAALCLHFTSLLENLKIDGWNKSDCSFSDHYQELAWSLSHSQGKVLVLHPHIWLLFCFEVGKSSLCLCARAVAGMVSLLFTSASHTCFFN